MWKAVDELLLQSIANGVYPGCAVAAGQGERVLYTGVHGQLAGENSAEVTHTTRYDVGMLTQVMATAPLALTALERGLISMDDAISRFLPDVPEDKRAITVQQLLTHTSGMAAHFLLPQEAESDRDALSVLLKHPLAGAPGAKVRDSDMGYILLGLMLERVFDMPIDEAMKRYVSAPLGMTRTGFLPSGTDVAPTEADDETGEPRVGVPHDRNARFLHGVAGHSGLFADLEDMILFAAMLSGSGHTRDAVPFSYRAIHLATTERTRGMNAARGYGFRITKRAEPFLGHLWPSDGYGLADPFGGSLIAVSPDDGFFVVLLSNAHTAPAEREERARSHKLLLNAAYAAFCKG